MYDMDTNVILAIVQIAAVAIVPLIVWWLGNEWQDRKAKEDAKRKLFFTLMANRQCNPLSKDWVDALNMIDVVFQDDKKVRMAWRAYYDSLDPSSQYNKSTNSFLLDLLSEMANSLGYKNLKQTEIDRAYTPQGFIDNSNIQNALQKELYRVLMSSKNYAEGYSVKQLKKHIDQNRGINMTIDRILSDECYTTDLEEEIMEKKTLGSKQKK